MMPNDVSYHFLNLDLTFNAISEGTSEFELDIAEINRNRGNTQGQRTSRAYLFREK